MQERLNRKEIIKMYETCINVYPHIVKRREKVNIYTGMRTEHSVS